MIKLMLHSKRDPMLLERTVYAFGLLEALVRVGIPFIFKGGTCLMLLMDTPRRLSTDIDIIVKPGTGLNDYLEKASAIFPFQRVEEQKRIGKNNIEKRHFKFTYESPISSKKFYILLDVLFEENHYAEVVTKEIRNDLLLTEEEYLTVNIPSADCILADKLTAFAPHTSGIELNRGKDMEVMKQLCVLHREARSVQQNIRYMSRVFATYADIFMQKTTARKSQLERQLQLCIW